MKYFRSVEKGRIVKWIILTINVMSYINKCCNIEPVYVYFMYVWVSELNLWPDVSKCLCPTTALSCQKSRIILHLQHFTNPSLLSLPLPAARSCPSSTLASVPRIILLTATVIFFFFYVKCLLSFVISKSQCKWLD